MSIKISWNEIFLFCMAVHFLEHSSNELGEATSSNICGGENWGRTGDAKQIARGLENGSSVYLYAWFSSSGSSMGQDIFSSHSSSVCFSLSDI